MLAPPIIDFATEAHFTTFAIFIDFLSFLSMMPLTPAFHLFRHDAIRRHARHAITPPPILMPRVIAIISLLFFDIISLITPLISFIDYFHFSLFRR
jgi:hypothetical protein